VFQDNGWKLLAFECTNNEIAAKMFPIRILCAVLG